MVAASLQLHVPKCGQRFAEAMQKTNHKLINISLTEATS